MTDYHPAQDATLGGSLLYGVADIAHDGLWSLGGVVSLIVAATLLVKALTGLVITVRGSLIAIRRDATTHKQKPFSENNSG